MWIVKLKLEDNGSQVTSIIHISSIVWGAHLIGVYGKQFLPHDFSYVDSLRAFQAYYIDKFIVTMQMRLLSEILLIFCVTLL